VPVTGQTASYATGDDGDLGKGVAWPNPRFTDNLDGTVTDNLTGLVWEQKTIDNKSITYNWQEALAYCENLSLAGHDDWRLPNIHELRSIIDYTRIHPSIDTTYFPNTITWFYWSSTTYGEPAYAYPVDFNDGYVHNNYNKVGGYHVRAVRGGQ